ncbi:MAG: YafY family protein [Ekhidna sp.]
MKRLERLTSLLSFLQSRRFSNIQEIEHKFQISERTIYRDLKALDEAGVPISFDRDNGYFILEGYFLPPLAFTLEEAKSFIFIEQLAEKYTDEETYRNFSSALEKIKNKFKDHLLQDIELLQSSVKAYIDKDYTPKYLQIVEQAVSHKNVLKITYQDANGNKSKRIIEPIGITFYSQTWHIIAFCQLRNDYRDFSISRVSEIQNTNEFIQEDRLDLADYIKKIT